MLRLISSTNEASSVVLTSCSQILDNVEVTHLISWAGCTTKGSGILHGEGCGPPKMLFCSARNSVLEDCKCLPPALRLVLEPPRLPRLFFLPPPPPSVVLAHLPPPPPPPLSPLP